MSELKEIMSKLEVIDQKVGSLDQKVDSLDQKVGSLDQKVDSLDQKVDSLDQKVNHLDEKIERVKTDLQEQIKVVEYVARQETQYVYQVVQDIHREMVALISSTNAENQHNQVILKSHTEKFNNLKQALS